jgi:hypothetical protein
VASVGEPDGALTVDAMMEHSTGVLKRTMEAAATSAQAV